MEIIICDTDSTSSASGDGGIMVIGSSGSVWEERIKRRYEGGMKRGKEKERVNMVTYLSNLIYLMRKNLLKLRYG